MPLIIDAHLDLAWNAMAYNRDMTRALEQVRAGEAGMTDEPDRGHGTVTLPEMRRGSVALCIATLLARSSPVPPRNPPITRTAIDFVNQDVAYATARGQMAYYERLEQRGEARIIRTRSDLEGHWGAWTASIPRIGGEGAGRPIGLIIGMECADPIVAPSHFRCWWELGLRNVELSHYGASHYAAGNTAPGALTGRGLELLEEMSRVGAMLDVTHLSDASMLQALEIYQGPVLASHHNCRALAPGERQLTDEQIRLIVEREGVIGTAMHNGMLWPDWKTGKTPRQSVTFDTAARHIDHVCQLAGDSLHAGIGSDMDGGFGVEAMPYGLESIADLPRLGEALDRRGYSSRDIDNIFHGNWLRLFRGALPD